MAAVLSRYARAFADVVMEKKLDATRTLEQVNSIVSLVNSSPDLASVWESPAIPVEQKRALLDSIAARLGLEKTVRNFVAVLIDHHRIVSLPQIAKQFETELYERLGLADVDVVSSRELSPEERKQLEQQIGRMAGKSVRAKYSTDRNLIGGAVVKMGSTVYDGSVRGQLQKMREELSAD